MAYLNTDDLKKLFNAQSCISPYDTQKVKNASYELSLGDQIYQTNSKSGKREILEDKGQISIEPGQFALLLTAEKVDIPLHLIGFISIKFKEKKKGLVNISGFHVDPGFKGKIKFSVYNAGPRTIILDKGQGCFVLWLSQLTGDAEPYNGDHQSQEDINSKDIEPLTGVIASPNELLRLINDNKEHLVKLYWASGIIISLCVAVSLNLYFKNSAYEEGYKFRIKEENLKQKIDGIVNAKIDSVLKKRISIDSGRAH
jgi:dCTP deaminase